MTNAQIELIKTAGWWMQFSGFMLTCGREDEALEAYETALTTLENLIEESKQ